jgi:ABC-2 type transport system permease protein
VSSSALSLRNDVLRAFVARDFAISRSYRLPFLLDLVYGLLELAVYFFISRAVIVTRSLDGAPSYFAFAAVGMVVALMVQVASQEFAYRVREQQLSGSLELLVTQPLGAVELCLGMAAFPFLFAVARAAAYLAIAGFWMRLDVSRTSWLGLGLVLLVTTTALLSLGIAAAALVIVLKRGQTIAGMVVFGMTLLGGSVFPVSALPRWLEPVGRIVPLRFAYDGARAALFRGDAWGRDVLVLGVFSVVGVPLSISLFRAALSGAARRGSLAQY